MTPTREELEERETRKARRAREAVKGRRRTDGAEDVEWMGKGKGDARRRRRD